MAKSETTPDGQPRACGKAAEAEASRDGKTLFILPETMVDQFRVVRLVGRGGMGEVYLARDTLLNRRVALKVIHPRFLDSEEAVARLMREAQLTASLSHPHIVTVYSIGKHQGRPYLALEYLEGQNLRQRMDEERPGIRESLRIVCAIAQALAEAHRHQVLHCDLKPENVILAKDGRLRLVDLGLAKVATESTDATRGAVERESATSTANHLADCQAAPASTVQGTPAYMVPEQWRGETCSEATDTWALGMILHELLAGRRPYQGTRKAFLGAAAIDPEPVPVLAPAQDIPAELIDLVARCLEKDSAKRPTAIQVGEALELLLIG
ncbi:MAG: serine/threonine-protein kinase, partial [Pseudomonadota bacterium]